ncbi:MAG: HAD-IC family P-type ATPase, partial [Clostridia bacterium]|nr:HAD-IC family P-type ATPase [Clostridia bacterium]
METKKTVIKIIASAILLAAAFITDRLTSFPVWADLLLYLPAYLVVGFGVLKECAENIVHGELLDEAFLMTVATVGALCIGFLPGAEPQFAEAVFVMLLFNVGELFEEIAEGRSRRSVMAIMELRPDVCDVLRDGKTVSVPCEEIAVGETVIVKPGERIAIDGLVLEGASTLDTAALTGESLPRSVSEGDSVASGCLNLSGVLKLKTTKPFGESTASKIIELVENASEKKSKSETMVKRFARVYTPAVVALAVLAAVVPPLISGDFAAAFPEWLKRALTFLIVSCPCALVISVPLTFFSGIGAAAKKGILIKGSEYVDALSRAETVVFDKTGTLTKGVFEVTAVHPEVCDEKSLLHLAAHVESFSTHPIALSLRQAYPESDDGCEVADVEETVGRGVKAKVNGETVLVGNDAFMDL